MALGEYRSFGGTTAPSPSNGYQSSPTTSQDPTLGYTATQIVGQKDGVLYYAQRRTDGGWDYFKTNSGTINPGVDFKLSQADSYKELGITPTDTTASAPTLPDLPADTGSGSAPAAPEYKFWNGVRYDISSQEGAQAYTNAVNDTILTNYKTQQKKIDELYNGGLIDLDTKLSMGRDNLTSLKKQRDESLKSIQGYFNRISPDAVQSEQNTLQNNVNEDYTTQTNKIGNLFNGAKAAEIANMDLNPYINDISTTGQIARAAKGLNTQKADQIAANDQWKTSATDETATSLANFGNNVSSPTAGDIVSEYLNNIQNYGTGVTNDGGAGFVSTEKVPEDIDYWNQ